jgi:quercetin dioxygenase-like cupin family protein
MGFINLNEIGPREMIPGFTAKFVHTGSMTVSHWTIRKGHALPQHAHPHEQVTNVVDGTFEITVGDETRVLEPGSVAVIPPNVTHSGRSISDCYVIDVFYPAREDYR